jgi:hypothetical protein
MNKIVAIIMGVLIVGFVVLFIALVRIGINERTKNPTPASTPIVMGSMNKNVDKSVRKWLKEYERSVDKLVNISVVKGYIKAHNVVYDNGDTTTAYYLKIKMVDVLGEEYINDWNEWCAEQKKPDYMIKYKPSAKSMQQPGFPGEAPLPTVTGE